MTNTELARFNMIEQQIRPAEVLDPRVLDLMADTARERFVPRDFVQLAFSDINIPLANGATMMRPIQEARMLQALNIQNDEHVLEIGTGSGYVTYLLSKLAKFVTSIEIDPSLHQQAKQALSEFGVENVKLVEGDGVNGWESEAPYDVIAVTGSLPLLNQSLQTQLRVGGRLFVITGTEPVMSATLITRVTEDQWSEDILFETVIPALQNAEKPPEFVF